MDPRVAPAQDGYARLPRASGDGPVVYVFKQIGNEVAPRERGWTSKPASVKTYAIGCPARAGMDPVVMLVGFRPPRLPRASGDGPTFNGRFFGRTEVAPRERGWTRIALGERDAHEGCPARAGMDPFAFRLSASLKGLPRASGDGPCLTNSSKWRCTVAPRERGWTLCASWCGVAFGGCPARAGMDPFRR